jgi:hypothetical protein
MTPQETEALQALERITATNTLLADDPLLARGFCENYKLIKPDIEKVLLLIQFIPVYGAQIVSLIKILMKGADEFCP